MVKVKRDLTGEKFARLMVIKQVEDHIKPNGVHESKWLCKCDCGNEIIVRGDNLRSGNTKSCGCLSIETANKTHKKYNKYDLSGEYGIGYTSNGEKFYFDLEDYDKIKDYCWCIDNKGYVITHDFKNQNKTILMHRFVMNVFDTDFVIDHKHGKYTRNDNRKKENLRIATYSQNNMNKTIRSNNISGVTGVYFDKKNNRWVANIKTNYIKKSKQFLDYLEAVKQRKKWEEEYFGEFSYDNSIGANNG